MMLIFWVLALFNGCFTVATRLSIDLYGNKEECIMESMNAHTTSNALFFRFHIIEPLKNDLVNVRVLSPSNKVIKTYPETQNEHEHIPVRENGLFSFCFQRHAYAQSKLSVYFNLEFLSVGSRTLTHYPSAVSTASKSSPQSTQSRSMELVKDSSVGLLHFSLSDLSSSLVHEQTRIMLLLSVEYVDASAPSSDISVTLAKVDTSFFSNGRIPNWNTLEKAGVFNSLSRRHTNVGTVSTGTNIEFDVTDEIIEGLEGQVESISFAVFSKSEEVAQIKITTMGHRKTDLWPMIVFEDMGDETMVELSLFRETLLSLRGDLTYIIQRERVSRDIAENANSRVKWMSLLLSLVLVGIGAGQIVAIRTLLETRY